MNVAGSPMLRRIILISLSLVVLVGGATLPYVWSGSHALKPGLSGCSTIRNAGPRIDCLRSQVLSAVKKDGLKAGLVELDSMKRSPQRISECHSAMHQVGRTIARTTKITGDSLVSGSSAQACSSGVAHGALEQVVSSNPEALQATASAICLHTQTRREAEACFHGAGHGLIRAKRTSANEACTTLRRDNGSVDCLSGASMEREMNTKVTKDVAKNVKLARANCDGNGAVLVACYTYFPYSVLPGNVDWTVKRYVDVCNTYAEPGPASWGCAHRTSNMMKTRNEIEGCTGLKSAVAVQVCSASVAAETDAGLLPLSERAKFCASHTDVAFGCGAGIGRMMRWKSKPSQPLAAVAAACSSLPAGDVRNGCTAGATACWFPERAERTASECTKVTLPTDITAEMTRYGGSALKLWEPNASKA